MTPTVPQENTTLSTSHGHGHNQAPPQASLESILVPLEQITLDPDNPRRDFPAAELEELAASIRANGVIQPITAIKDEKKGGYRLLFGERRFRAAQLAGLQSIQVIVRHREPTQTEALELRLLENLARSDLRPMDLARGLERALVLKGGSAAELAQAVGISAAACSRALALLKLPACLRQALEKGTVCPAVAYEVGKVACEKRRVALAERVVAEGLTRDAVLALVARMGQQRSTKKKDRSKPRKLGWHCPGGLHLAIAAPRGESLDGDKLIAALEMALKQCKRCQRQGLPLPSWAEEDRQKAPASEPASEAAAVASNRESA